MKKFTTSTWVLIAVVIVTGALGATLWFTRPAGFPGWYDQEKSSEWIERHWSERLEDMPSEKVEEFIEKGLEEWPYLHPFREGCKGGHFGVFRGDRFGHSARHFPVLGLFVIGGAAALIIVTVKNRKKRTTEKSALCELEEQFAQGKIDEEEFKRRRTILREEPKEE